jgi:pimeloyl-ACP methyl ester carboxylesterase
VAVDQRGHGESSAFGDQAAYRFDHLVDDLGRFLDALDAGPVHLLGHSMGGLVALRHVLAHPDTVRSLVLMDTAAAPASELPLESIEKLAAIGREHGMATAHQVTLDELRKAEEADAERRVAEGRPPRRRPRPPADPGRDARVAWSFGHLDPEAFVAFGRELVSYPSLEHRLGEVACPTTVIVGELDKALRPGADVLAAGIPGAALQVVAGAAHSPQEEATEAWLAAVEGHLARA